MNALELSERLKQHKIARLATEAADLLIRLDDVTPRCNYLERSQVVAMLRTAVTESGLSQVAWAKKHGVSDRYVNGVLMGRVDPGPSILKALGLRKHTVFMAVEQGG